MIFRLAAFEWPDLTDERSRSDALRALSDVLHNELVQVGLAIIAFVIVNRLVRDVVARIVKRSVRPGRYKNKEDRLRRAQTVTKVCQTAASGVIWVIGIVFVLGLLHVNIAALATGAGLVSVVIGLSAQNTIKDFLSGIFIIIENQYAVGDVITVRTAGGFEITGTVEDLSIRITKLRDLQGMQHIITNGSAVVISNSTARYSAVNISIHIGYTANLEKVQQIINQVGQDMLKDEDWGKNIIEPIQFLRINDFEDYAVSALMLGKVKPGTQFEIAGEFRSRLLIALKANHIQVPTSQIVAGKGNE